MSRVLKQMFSDSSADDGSMLGVVNQMVVTELLDNGQPLDIIVGCMKVCLAELIEFVCWNSCKCWST